MWFPSLFKRNAPASNTPESLPLYFHNTLTQKKDVFISIVPHKVRMYNCGPTVYDHPHIGNIRSFVFADTLRRILEYNGYDVKQVMNVTDVGHLTSDADEGEDKIEKRAKEAGQNVKDIVQTATDAFFIDLEKLNAKSTKTEYPRASAHIPEQIAFVKTLEEKGYTYTTDDGIYFDTSKFRTYGKLGNVDISGLKEGARVKQNIQKHNPTDFALWKFSPKSQKREQEWNSPWGVGFPGWHLECSAMAMKYLGKRLDIHTGGIDHIPIHHNNEIAQTESVTGDTFVNYWMHVAFITIEGRKISKSLGNTIHLRNIVDRGIPALAYRYWLLTSNYATPVNFTWEALEAAKEGFFKLHRFFVEKLGSKSGTPIESYQKRFHAFINDNVDTPQTIALLHELMKDTKHTKPDIRATFLDFDRVLGLGFKESNKKLLENLSGETKLSVDEVPKDIMELIGKRNEARQNKDFTKADELRGEIEAKGYHLVDTDTGTNVVKKTGESTS